MLKRGLLVGILSAGVLTSSCSEKFAQNENSDLMSIYNPPIELEKSVEPEKELITEKNPEPKKQKEVSKAPEKDVKKIKKEPKNPKPAKKQKIVKKVPSTKYEKIKEEISKLHKLYATECAPEEIAFAEAYLESADGIKLENEIAHVNKIDKLIFLQKAEVYASLARDKVYSDVDKDGVPCYQEVAEGSNPNVSDLKNVEKENKQIKKSVMKYNQSWSKKENVKKKGWQSLKIHARVHFEFNKADIKKEYLPYLNVIIRHLKNNSKLLVKIIGYTDNIGPKSYNDKLAMKRAKAVRNYLIKHGISPKRIEILGKGKADYLFDNKNELNRFTNRRADFFIMEPTQKEGA